MTTNNTKPARHEAGTVLAGSDRLDDSTVQELLEWASGQQLLDVLPIDNDRSATVTVGQLRRVRDAVYSLACEVMDHRRTERRGAAARGSGYAAASCSERRSRWDVTIMSEALCSPK